MPEHIIKTIHKVRVAGKYTEFWFKEDLQFVQPYHNENERFCIEEGFHGCLMTYMLIEYLEKEELYNDVLMYGLKYRKTVWARSKYGTHWNFISFLNETRIVLIEKTT